MTLQGVTRREHAATPRARLPLYTACRKWLKVVVSLSKGTTVLAISWCAYIYKHILVPWPTGLWPASTCATQEATVVCLQVTQYGENEAQAFSPAWSDDQAHYESRNHCHEVRTHPWRHDPTDLHNRGHQDGDDTSGTCVVLSVPGNTKELCYLLGQLTVTIKTSKSWQQSPESASLLL